MWYNLTSHVDVRLHEYELITFNIATVSSLLSFNVYYHQCVVLWDFPGWKQSEGHRLCLFIAK